MSSGFKLTCFCALPLLLTWACAPDLDSLSAGYADANAGGTDSGKAGSSNTSGSSNAGPACENLDRDSDESDVDCGGTSDCKRCTTNLRCGSNKDCLSGFCKGSRCAEPTCGDGAKNQDETAIDCGGSCAPELACAVGAACAVNQDCKSEFCEDEVCADHCASGVPDGDETDKDCGGSCDKCDDGKHCLESSDCQSLLCVNNECQAPTCNDKTLNQDESDKDCGGACALVDKACPVTARCNSGADCESWVCEKSKCVADIEVAAADVIDTFEDADFLLPALAGRVGTWYKYGDPSGTVTEEIISIQRGPSSKRGILNTGKGFTGWGSGLGVDMNNPGGRQEDKVPYDASAYSGVTFWARADAPVSVAVVFPNGDTDLAGGTCEICDHHWLKSVPVDTEWKRYTVLFSELAVELGGDPEPTEFDATSLVSLQFRFLAGLTYELSIDDVAFVKN